MSINLVVLYYSLVSNTAAKPSASTFIGPIQIIIFPASFKLFYILMVSSES